MIAALDEPEAVRRVAEAAVDDRKEKIGVPSLSPRTTGAEKLWA